MTTTERALLGYDEVLKEVNGGYDYHTRSYTFKPIYEGPRGAITTAAIRCCRECRKVISAMGGPGIRSVCPSCYGTLKLRDFAEGHTHTMLEK